MKKYQIGYTTGVFDLFHIGHLNILRRAKEQCEYLIVGVSTDELVETYKNRAPIINFESRKRIIEAIKYVDRVVAQESRDKLSALNHLKFNVMFVGSDWRDSSLFNELEVKLKEQDVDLIYLDYTDEISSTIIAQKLTNNNI